MSSGCFQRNHTVALQWEDASLISVILNSWYYIGGDGSEESLLPQSISVQPGP